MRHQLPESQETLLHPCLPLLTPSHRRLFKGSKTEVPSFALGANTFVEAIRTALGTHLQRSCWPPAKRPGHQERGKISQGLICVVFFFFSSISSFPSSSWDSSVKDSLEKETQESIHLLNMSLFREAYKTSIWTTKFNFKQMSKM